MPFYPPGTKSKQMRNISFELYETIPTTYATLACDARGRDPVHFAMHHLVVTETHGGLAKGEALRGCRRFMSVILAVGGAVSIGPGPSRFVAGDQPRQ
jgi:hypothetical protein